MIHSDSLGRLARTGPPQESLHLARLPQAGLPRPSHLWPLPPSSPAPAAPGAPRGAGTPTGLCARLHPLSDPRTVGGVARHPTTQDSRHPGLLFSRALSCLPPGTWGLYSRGTGETALPAVRIRT